MKIRNGFVSNSSSSSYIVKIRDTYWDEFCDIVVDGNNSYMKDNLLKEIDEDIVRFEGYIKEEGIREGSVFVEMNKEHLVQLNKWKEILTPEKVNNEVLVEVALAHSSIRRNETHKDVVELSSLTTMHNSFDEGMTKLLKEIVLLFSFDTKKKIECEREDYGG